MRVRIFWSLFLLKSQILIVVSSEAEAIFPHFNSIKDLTEPLCPVRVMLVFSKLIFAISFVFFSERLVLFISFKSAWFSNFLSIVLFVSIILISLEFCWRIWLILEISIAWESNLSLNLLIISEIWLSICFLRVSTVSLRWMISVAWDLMVCCNIWDFSWNEIACKFSWSLIISISVLKIRLACLRRFLLVKLVGFLLHFLWWNKRFCKELMENSSLHPWAKNLQLKTIWSRSFISVLLGRIAQSKFL